MPVWEAQIDEFWGFVFKKEKNLTEEEKIRESMGDMWTFTAIMPDTKLIFAHIIGKRTKDNARKLIAMIRQRSDGTIPYISSDGNKDYTDSIASVFGEYNKTNDEITLPDKLCYAQVVKTIENGRCRDVDKRIIFGNDKLIEECILKSKVSHTINTSFIERSNLTMRQHNHRVERKSQGFSKELEYHKYQNSLSIAYYNFCLPHRSLRYYLKDRKIENTPAMETGLTDHIWSMKELLSVTFAPD